ncbi:hypothetical protein INT47_010405, partial [Mucor saturninus]
CFYIMTKRYRCLSSSCSSTFNGYDSKIMRQLPIQLQAEFPAYLSHRGAVSKQVGDFLRPCIQNSMGPERIAKVLRELHILKHDRSELQYLTAMKTYIRTIYTSIIETLRPNMDKQMMLLGGKVLKGDPSFNMVKHMASIDGTSIFTALYTLCNEFEEIRMMLPVPTMSLEHPRWSFNELMNACEGYSHEKPIAFYTDNVRGDRRFLESVIPSLKDGCRSRRMANNESEAQNHSVLSLPENIQVSYLRNYEEIESVMKNLLAEHFHFVVGSDGVESCPASVVTGFDCEWPYNRNTHAKGKLSVFHIAHNSSVLVMHLNPTWKTLPQSLVYFLKSPVILKIGRQVGGDFKQIKDSFGVDCEGSFELGPFCRLKKAIRSGSSSLSAICKELLGKGLSKDLRVSGWSYAHELTPGQIRYAALDAWVSLEIYDILKNTNEEIFGNPVAVQYVSLWLIWRSRICNCQLITNDFKQNYS